MTLEATTPTTHDLGDERSPDSAPPRAVNPFSTLASPDKIVGLTFTSMSALEARPRVVSLDLLRIFLAERVPITLWGPVGARKTRTIEAMAREKDANGVPFQVVTMQPSTQDPSIIHGMMYTALEDNKTIMKRSIPQVAETVREYHEVVGGYTILFADEMTTCMISQQNAMLGVISHMKFEGVDLSGLISVVMAANPEGTVSTVNPLSEAVINRGGHIPFFGDLELFLDDWSTGFNGAYTPPDLDTQWYVREMLSLAPDKAFRSNSGSWSTDSLVPYELFEHSERAVTEFAKILTRINDLFSAGKPEIRHHYVIEAARALLGPTWAVHMATILAREEQRINPGRYIELIREHGFDQQIPDTDTLRKVFSPEAWSIREGNNRAASEILSVIEELAEVYRTERKRDNFLGAYRAHLALFALAASAPSESDYRLFKPRIREHLQGILVDQEVVTHFGKEKILPRFLGEHQKEILREE